MNKLNPYAAPSLGLHDADEPARMAHIAALPVSDAWKTRFSLIDSVGGPAMPRLKDLTAKERFSAMFNVLAFLFWPVYYFIKGMWMKGITMVAIAFVALFVISIVLDGLGLGHFVKGFGCAIGAVFAVRANIDYYRKMVLNEVDDWL
jgi:hypothetical protein